MAGLIALLPVDLCSRQDIQLRRGSEFFAGVAKTRTRAEWVKGCGFKIEQFNLIYGLLWSIGDLL